MKSKAVAKIKPDARTLKHPASMERLRKNSLRFALRGDLLVDSGRRDLASKIAPPGSAASKRAKVLAPERRAGWPLVRRKGSADPKQWFSAGGKHVSVDFSRAAWLPDDWAQGVTTLNKRFKAELGVSCTFTVYMPPSGTPTLYSQRQAEKQMKRKFTTKDGFRGQLRFAALQDHARPDPDAKFFKLLTPAEKRYLPGVDDLHFCVVSARRANCNKGARDIAVVQQALTAAGVVPTWYVDDESLQDYIGLGLQAVAGGKLTAARNRALNDAYRRGKACVQLSDDISLWEYHDGAQATAKTMEAMNAAHHAATRYVVSPVAAARFVLAKMRGCKPDDRGRTPKLGGAYMLGNCSRTWGGAACSRQHFIIGDFFVADKSLVRFDDSLRLKEDYDFTCAHIQKHGSVLRCNRLTFCAKHYKNPGGACTVRDTKGKEEQRNIAILTEKWPHAIHQHPTRKNEVVLRWSAEADAIP